MIRKDVSAFLVLGGLCLALAACGGSPDPAPPNDPNDPTPTTEPAPAPNAPPIDNTVHPDGCPACRNGKL